MHTSKATNRQNGQFVQLLEDRRLVYSIFLQWIRIIPFNLIASILHILLNDGVCV